MEVGVAGILRGVGVGADGSLRGAGVGGAKGSQGVEVGGSEDSQGVGMLKSALHHDAQSESFWVSESICVFFLSFFASFDRFFF